MSPDWLDLPAAQLCLPPNTEDLTALWRNCGSAGGDGCPLMPRANSEVYCQQKHHHGAEAQLQASPTDDLGLI
ncbi:hypothetical protein Q5P01_015585 [Channa striata]|uniref:Uncharacterized protein n=1 Tax=Channa striata TaxID=64152 RepID=A0AA88MEQ4_CHASR|nr:hypothetical protein Q5P01_015585 [Channa striata]